MRSSKWRLRAGLLSAAALVAFTPLGVQPGQGFAKTTAQCETCCTENTSHCVICGTRSCVDAANYYEAKIGSPCSQQRDLEPY